MFSECRRPHQGTTHELGSGAKGALMRCRLSIAAVLGVTAALVLSGPAGAQTPTQDSATGTGSTSSYTSFSLCTLPVDPPGRTRAGTPGSTFPLSASHTQSAQDRLLVGEREHRDVGD